MLDQLLVSLISHRYTTTIWLTGSWHLTTIWLTDRRHLIDPPEPLYEIWRDDIWSFQPAGDLEEARAEAGLDPLLSAVFERPEQVYDPEDPPDLLRE